MAFKKVYLITIPNWEKHNPKKNKGYTYFMFHNGFFSDAKVSQLRQLEILLFIYLLCIASELKTNSFQIHVKLLPKCLRMHDKLLHNSLISLQSLQLLTYAPLNKIKGIEENRIEEKEIETTKVVSLSEQKISDPPEPEQQKLFFEKKLDTEKKLKYKASQPVDLNAVSRIQDLVALIPETTRKSWRELYAGDEEFVKRQLIRCWQYYAIDKPHRRPRKINGWSRAINTWLEREWVKHSLKIKPGQHRV